MGKLELKSEQLFSALDRLEEAVVDFNEIEKQIKQNDLTKDDRKYRTYRDSLIQRFELCVDLFWKYLKRYLVEGVAQKVDINAPKPVIRAACKAKLLSEQDAEVTLEMIQDRNTSSHIYKEEVADQISRRIPQYYKLIRKYAEQLKLPQN